MKHLYEFVDTIERPKKVAPSLQTILNDINLDKALTDGNGSFITLTVYGRNNYAQQIKTFEVPGLDGVVEQNEPRAEPREITVKFKIQDKDSSSLQERLNSLRSLLQGAKKRLVFTDESAYFYATFADLELPEEESNNLVGTITFLCSDPKKYSTTEKNLLFPADIVTIENKGTAEALPIFELEATKKTTFAMVSNQNDEYNLVGQPADVDEQLVDEKNCLLYENGDTLDTWQVPSGSTGRFIKGSQGIQVESYGTGDKWHGPTLTKEIDPTQDFEIEMYVYVRTERPNQAFRVSTNFFDENMNELGMLRVWDKTTSRIKKVIEARLGPYVDKYENYLISDRNYNWVGQRVWGGVLRVVRKGNEFTFYVAHISQQGKHFEPLTITFNDKDNKYAGKLKYINIDIAIFGSVEIPNEIGINNIRVYRHNRILVDQTPYIMYPGDKLTLDHVEKNILLNGEVRKDLKNFGASFFTLKKGENRLIITPEDSFRTRVKFRERHL